MRHILFISYDGMTDPLGQSQVIPYLAGLTRYGYRFTLLSCDKPDKFRQHSKEVDRLLQGLPIKWISIPYHKSPPVLSSMYDFQKMKSAIRELQSSDPVDMVHTRPGIPALLGIWMKKTYGTAFLNDIRGFWADERVDGGMWNLRNPLYKAIYRFFRKREDEAIRLADHNTCLTNRARTEIGKWKQVPHPVSIEVIPCSVDMERFNPDGISAEKKASLLAEAGFTKDHVIISYLGSIGGWYLTREMMDCCKVIAESLPQARFLFISNNRHEEIYRAAQLSGLPADKLYIRFAKASEVPEWLSLSHYSLFFIKPCYSKLSSSPTKQAEIMAMGIPIITNSGVGDVKEIIESGQAGIVIDDFDRRSYERVATSLRTEPGPQAKSRIRQAAIHYFDLNKAVERYHEVYSKIAAKRPK